MRMERACQFVEVKGYAMWLTASRGSLHDPGPIGHRANERPLALVRQDKHVRLSQCHRFETKLRQLLSRLSANRSSTRMRVLNVKYGIIL